MWKNVNESQVRTLLAGCRGDKSTAARSVARSCRKWLRVNVTTTEPTVKGIGRVISFQGQVEKMIVQTV